MNQPVDPGVGDFSPIFMIVFGLVGAGMGLACGKIPMAYATERRRDGLGLGAMITCVLFGFMGGCVLALPVAMVFTVIILCLGQAETDTPGSRRREPYVPWKPPVAATGPVLPGPYSKIGPVVVCNECRHAMKPGAEGVPETCPSCGINFQTKAAEVPVVAPMAPRSEHVPQPEPRRKLVSWRDERRRGNLPRADRVTSARRRVAQSREDAPPPPPAKGSDDVIELRPESDDPRGW